ncbi:ferredoxin [Cryobacterium sp. PAMC25264]|nr:ferredoxin [Cryobacterium sp. PAMC25264]
MLTPIGRPAAAAAHPAGRSALDASTAGAAPDARTVLHIDWTACDGRGLCTELLPELLQRDEWGYPLALGYGSDVPVPGQLLAAATDAVSLCRRQALALSRQP